MTKRRANIQRGKIVAVLIALGLHLAALTVLGLSRGRVILTPPVADRIPMQLRLVQLADLGGAAPHPAVPLAPTPIPSPAVEQRQRIAKPAPAPVTTPPAPAPPAPKPPTPQAASAPPAASAAASPGMMGPETAAASSAAATAGGVRTTLRENIGCDDEKYLKMPSSERDKCAQRFGRLAKDAPHVRALDLQQKAFFDGDCDPPDDEWCLYRRGKGPYPGLLSLYKKYHPHNDH